jgi:DNA-binding protein H-NS
MAERDYSAYKVDPTSRSDLHNRMLTAAAQQEAITGEIAELERQLKEKQEELRQVSETVLPELMEEIGLKEIVTLNGTKIKIQELVTASCPAPSTRDPELMKRRSRIFKWLDDNGYGKLISRELKVEFDRSQVEAAVELEKRLRGEKYQVQRQYAVHPQTFNKFARDMLADGKELPEDFKIHRRNVAKIVKD